ncbi:DNA helicase RecQ [Deinococcus sp.]|uniref:DNA helicase RecQ n=1 Tax=Deinococcus sp. TaxID=47478 RepID=UPI002869C097|nr:DNA helicase RecQ [Deinococcus sp.]
MTTATADPMPRALALLKQVWGYDAFRGVQADIVRTVVEGGNALVLMPTGGGKSLCYQLPSLLRPGVGVIVSPLIALMKDQVDTLRQLGVRAAFLNSSLSLPETRDVEAALMAGTLDLLYVAPERLLLPRTLELLERAQVGLFAIDEAHCVSQWGHDFRPEYQQLRILPERFPDIPRVALTATADDRTRADILSVLDLQGAPQFISSFDRPNIQYRVANKEGPKTQLLDFIVAEHGAGRQGGDAGIVYCLSRKSVEETARWLVAQGIDAVPYHAGLPPRERSHAQERFLNEEGLIVCATVAFGMGIDKPNVRFVAHLDLPKSMEGYYQETGRAGRDGLPGTAWMVYGLADVVNVRRMLASSDAPEDVKRVESAKLDALLTYCEAATCRRQMLLAYFGEDRRDPCGNCDVCLNPPQVRDMTREAQMALSAAIRSGNRFGAAHLTDILMGRATEKVVSMNHHTLPTFGVGALHDEKTWRGVLRQLVSLGYLAAGEHHGLSATGKARALLKGEATLALREDTLIPRVSKRDRDRVRSSAAKAPVDAHDQPLFEALRAWRLAKARELAVPPYVIFTDASLKGVAELRPGSHATLGTVSGVGQRKLAEFGDDVLGIVRDHSHGDDRPARVPTPAELGARTNSAVLGLLKPRPSAAPAPLLDAPVLLEPSPEVADALRELRKVLARETGHSAFVIFPNAALDTLAARQPRTVGQLQGLPGLGPKRIEAYGERIVGAINMVLDG